MKIKQKSLFHFFLLIAVVVFMNAVPVFAAERAIPSITVDVQ